MLGADENGGTSKQRRQHGFQLPLHPLQLCGLLVLVVLTIGSFTVLIPALPVYSQPATLATFWVILLLHLCGYLGATLLDPAETELRYRKSVLVPELDRDKHSHVIESGRCNLCQIGISGSRTKHCSSCNKCVAGFDHHCKWLNHCIGARNYKLFLMCISTAVAAAALVAALAFAQLIINNSSWYSLSKDVDKELTNTGNNSTKNYLQLTESSNDTTFVVVITILGLLAVITAGLLLHLCFFHVYISFLGLTTYEYIRQQRQSQLSETISQGKLPNGSTTFQLRPVNLYCSEVKTKTTFFSCTATEEQSSTSTTSDSPSSSSNSSQDCQMCIITNNSVAPEIKPQVPRKPKRKWNCCLSVPDSPDDPHSPSEPRCLMSLCKHRFKSKSVPVKDGRPHRTHGHWSSTKLRMILKVLGTLGNKKTKNQSQQSSQQDLRHQGISSISNEQLSSPVSCYVGAFKRANVNSSLSVPSPKHVSTERDLSNAISAIQNQQRYNNTARRPLHRRGRRSLVHRPKTPALSPIRESGLSNPASPSRQNCTVPDKLCNRPLCHHY